MGNPFGWLQAALVLGTGVVVTLMTRRRLDALRRMLSEHLIALEVTLELRLVRLETALRAMHRGLIEERGRGGLALAHPASAARGRGRGCRGPTQPPRRRPRAPCTRGPRSLRRTGGGEPRP